MSNRPPPLARAGCIPVPVASVMADSGTLARDGQQVSRRDHITVAGLAPRIVWGQTLDIDS